MQNIHKIIYFYLLFSFCALLTSAQSPDYWLEKNQIATLNSHSIRDSLQWAYFISKFPEAQEVQIYSPESSYKVWLRFQEGEMEYSLEICSETWGDGLYKAYHIHNSALLKRKIINNNPDWSLIEEEIVMQAIQNYLQKKNIGTQNIDIFAFGQHDWEDSHKFSKANPEEIAFRYGIYDGNTLYVFDKEGQVTIFEPDRDYHWSY